MSDTVREQRNRKRLLEDRVGVRKADKDAQAFQAEGIACAEAQRSKWSSGARILILSRQSYRLFISQFKKSFWLFFFINNYT